MKRCGVFVVVIFIAYGGVALGAKPSHTNFSSLQMDALGASVHLLKPVGMEDLPTLEPVCALIFKHQNLLRKDRSLQQWYVQLKSSPLLDLPQFNIAKDVVSFHHYCYAKIAEGRYYRAEGRHAKNYLADYAAGNISFVISHKEYRPANWPYLSKLYVDYGNALMLGDKPSNSGEAIGAYENALQQNKGYIPAMLALARVYEKLGKKDKALEYVKEGLRYRPTSDYLKRRFKELGGKPPYPEPYASPQPTTQTEKNNPGPQTNQAKNKGGSESIITPNTKEAVQSTAPKINTPSPADSIHQNQNKSEMGADDQPQKKRYCRFCP